MTKRRAVTQVLLTTIAIAVGSAAMAADLSVQQAPEVIPGRYIVEWVDPPVLTFDGLLDSSGHWKMAPTRPDSASFDPSAKAVVEYRSHLDEKSNQMLQSVSELFANPVKPLRRYRYALNGVALAMSPSQAKHLATESYVKQIIPVTVHRPHTDAGPAWIGAPGAWGTAGNMGEGVVVGVVDSGVNWDHPAFADIGGDDFDHDNPRGRQFGLCSNAQVLCNDKLIGVYDFTEEGTRLGRDLDGHGTHVASTAVGNIRLSNLVGNTGSVVRNVSGVAPHANLITYKVCLADDVSTPDVDENVCLLDAILSAFEQIVVDQVDVVNYSIGGNSSNPWTDNDALTMLTARDAGVLTVTSAGNGGSAPDTISSPANAPWLLAVANVTHNRRFENVLEICRVATLSLQEILVVQGFLLALVRLELSMPEILGTHFAALGKRNCNRLVALIRVPLIRFLPVLSTAKLLFVTAELTAVLRRALTSGRPAPAVTCWPIPPLKESRCRPMIIAYLQPILVPAMVTRCANGSAPAAIR